jgi:hypothetical protein
MRTLRICVFATIVAVLFTAGLAIAMSPTAPPPSGWILTGSAPQLYSSGIDANAHHDGAAVAYLISNQAPGEQFGTMMQEFSAKDYAGQRLSFSAYVKSDRVGRWACIWMRVDGAAGKMLAFDNMRDRPIKGTSDWKRYSVVLDVPADSQDIALGLLMNGQGEVEISGITLSTVSRDVPTTGGSTSPPLPPKPQNLDFSH